MASKAPSWRTDKVSANDRGYTWKWRQARERFLSQHPLCELCERRGLIEPATVVDHKVPHQGDLKLFWDRKNWSAICSPCHNGAKQRLEKTGVVIGCDANGIPLDPTSHWNK